MQGKKDLLAWRCVCTDLHTDKERKGAGEEKKDMERERNTEKRGKILVFGEFGCRVNTDSLFCNFFCTSEMILK